MNEMNNGFLPKVNIVEIPIFAGQIREAVTIVLNHFHKAENLCISATGAHGIVESYDNIEFKQILQGYFLNLPDGMPNVWYGRLKGFKKMGRCYGPEFFKILIQETSDTNIRHFLCGGKEGVADQLKSVCITKFNNRNIVGTYSPPFLDVDQYNYAEIGNIINDTGADIIWIGLSTPKQEWFAYRLSKFTRSKYIIAVGAAFDFHIDAIRQAPEWVQNAGLEWLFRLSMEPKRLFKRYLHIIPRYISLSLVDFVKFVLKNDQI